MSATSRRVLVTGASSGIGLALAEVLADRGHRVIATARAEPGLDRLRSLAERFPARVVVLRLDVNDPDAVDEVLRRTTAEGPLDVLVNNAGIAISGFVEDLAMEDFRAVLETNFFAVVALSKRAFAAMREQRSGTIVQVSSGAARIGLPMMSAYAASKHALRGFSEALASEAEPYGVRVVQLELGNHRTPMQLGGSPMRGADGANAAAATGLTRRAAALVTRRGADPGAAARAIVEVVEAPDPPVRRSVGLDAAALIFAVRFLPSALPRTGVRRALRSAGYPSVRSTHASE